MFSFLDTFFGCSFVEFSLGVFRQTSMGLLLQVLGMLHWFHFQAIILLQ
jgi:hypothetical protein